MSIGELFVQSVPEAQAPQSPVLLPHHHALISELASLSVSSHPTTYHKYLKSLDIEDRLLRVYTQNIDMLEEKAGLELGIPPASTPSPRKKRKAMSPPSTPCRTPREVSSDPSHSETNGDEKSGTFRAIPLHGTLSSLYCPVCSTSVPLLPHLPLPSNPIPCPTCDDDSSIRVALAERPRRTGFLRPSVVLYGEEHPEGERIGQVVERDLKGTGSRENREGRVDFLLVCGTSLSIPGVKRIVKEMAKSLHARPGEDIRTVLVNDEPPKPSAEWEEVFDVFLKGDIQEFTVDYLVNPDYVLPPATPKKRKSAPSTPRSTPVSTKKRKGKDDSSDWTTTPPSKKLPVAWLPTPRPTPPAKSKAVTDIAGDSRRFFEGSLTPISEDEEGGLVNPFLDIGRHL